MIRIGVLLLGLLVAAGASCPVAAQNIGDRVMLESPNPQGVPVHPAAGNNSFERWANQTLGTVGAIDAATGWFRIDSASKSGWVIRRYLVLVGTEPDDDPPGGEIASYVVGTWNLEHFHDGAPRGFPENTQTPKGPSYPSRTPAQFTMLAQAIKTQLGAKILVLNEINGTPNTRQSVEMDRLLGQLGAGWAYELASSGDAMRIAILYDSRFARKDKCVEFTIAEMIIQSKDIFERDPIACLFTFLNASGQPMNDLVVVGLHLASGQDNNRNHNTAMETLRQRLNEAFGDNTFPAGEKDILIGGDLNANRYGGPAENFWDKFDPTGFQYRTLSPDDGEEYLATRLASVPVSPRSKIDYLIASGVKGGLVDELVQNLAEVHHELLANGFDEYRKNLSDHLPVTVRVRVVKDVD